MKVGGGGGEGRKEGRFPSFLSHPLPAFTYAIFPAINSRSSCLLLNRTETLATQATSRSLLVTNTGWIFLVILR